MIYIAGNIYGFATISSNIRFNHLTPAFQLTNIWYHVYAEDETNLQIVANKLFVPITGAGKGKTTLCGTGAYQGGSPKKLYLV